MSSTIQAFNSCKRAIGQLLVQFDQELTVDQKTALGRAWASWTVVDRVGRARARKIIHDVLGDRALDVVQQLDQFNKENRPR
jgi:hypothetical protein